MVDRSCQISMADRQLNGAQAGGVADSMHGGYTLNGAQAGEVADSIQANGGQAPSVYSNTQGYTKVYILCI